MLIASKEVWTVSAEPVLKCWSFESRKCVKTIKLKTAGQITAMCAHDDTIWLVQDTKLMEFSASKAKLKREKQFDRNQFVSALLYLPSTDRLWIGLSRNIAIYDATVQKKSSIFQSTHFFIIIEIATKGVTRRSFGYRT